MIRKIIHIDDTKCNGCGLCASACHEGAIAMVDGKARLIRDDYCDGMGDCLPTCPTGAISFEEREAAAYDEAAVKARMAAQTASPCAGGGCPGHAAKSIARPDREEPSQEAQSAPESELRQWPVQIKLAPINAPYFEGANLLIAADCTAFSYADFHRRFIRNHIALIGCPKLDEGDYAEKLAEIIRRNDIQSVKVVRMEVPCCGGIVNAVRRALVMSGKMIPWQVIVISTDGQILSN